MKAKDILTGAGAGALILAASGYVYVGSAWAGSGDLPALIQTVVPIDRPITVALGEAEQGRWQASIRPDAFELQHGTYSRPAGELVHPAVGVRFAVDLPGRERLELVVDGLTEVVEGVVTMSGKVINEPDHDFVLSLEGEKLLGTIEQGEDIWLIEPDDQRGDHLLRKVRRSLIARAPDDDDDSVPNKSSKGAALPMSSPAPMAGTNGGVDVLFLYASNVTNPNLRASDIVGRFSLVRNNSAISSNISITSVGVFPVGSTFNGLDRQSILNKMKNGQAPFLSLEDWMIHTNADVAFLLVTEDPMANDIDGYGRAGGIAVRFKRTQPFALSTINYALGDNTTIHELGHVFGGHHEGVHTVTAPDMESTNHPMISSTCAWMTIMGGYDKNNGGCQFTGLPPATTRINYFSNPQLSPVAAGGSVIGSPGYAGMAAWLEYSMPIVSGWRDNGGTWTPAAPATLSHINLQCWGGNLMQWATVAGATEYRLFRSDSPGFIAPTQVYQGASASLHVSVPTAGAYFRVHACNSSGCSNWAGTEHAPWFSGCL